MLTRLEVNGFKNLVDFALDFGPYTCIAGPNGVGKSNIFDAIRFFVLTDGPHHQRSGSTDSQCGRRDRRHPGPALLWRWGTRQPHGVRGGDDC